MNLDLEKIKGPTDREAHSYMDELLRTRGWGIVEAFILDRARIARGKLIHQAEKLAEGERGRAVADIAFAKALLEDVYVKGHGEKELPLKLKHLFD